ncbi:hypothetical protein V1527DRAFT_486081 [Lipomyces starkeyi]
MCWADSDPIQTWLPIPYRYPENEARENGIFNFTLSAIRVRSEHCNLYLKGRLRPLQELRIMVDSVKKLKFAALWIRACIIIHSVALIHEQDNGFDISDMEQHWMANIEPDNCERVPDQTRAEKTQHFTQAKAHRDFLRDAFLDFRRHGRY